MWTLRCRMDVRNCQHAAQIDIEGGGSHLQGLATRMRVHFNNKTPCLGGFLRRVSRTSRSQLPTAVCQPSIEVVSHRLTSYICRSYP